MNEDLGLIVAGVGIGITLLGLSISIVCWFGNFSEDRKEVVETNRKNEKTLDDLQMEMKDFHYRLVEIERHFNKN